MAGVLFVNRNAKAAHISAIDEKGETAVATSPGYKSGAKVENCRHTEVRKISMIMPLLGAKARSEPEMEDISNLKDRRYCEKGVPSTQPKDSSRAYESMVSLVSKCSDNSLRRSLKAEGPSDPASKHLSTR